MHHVVQANLFNEFGFRTLLDALESNGCPYTVVKVIPFAHVLEPEIEFRPDEKVLVWGSLTLDGIAKERGWNPGCFQNENFDMRVMHKVYGNQMLNSDATFCTFAEMEFDSPMFCRPVHDTKTFSGQVITPEELTEWKERAIGLSNTGYSTLRPDTPVMYASPKTVQFEARFFVVDGKVVTGSVYRSFGNVMYQRVDSNNPLFNPMIQYVQSMVHYWEPTNLAFRGVKDVSGSWGGPAKGFVLDVAAVDTSVNFGYRVIEMNCLNSAGFYACDMNAVVRALENSYCISGVC